MEDGFNCFIFYMGSLDKCCFLFQKLFEKWFSTDAESLKRFAAHARSACSLAVAGCENTFFNKWVKSFKPGYVPEKERVLLRYLHSALKCFLGLCGHCLRPFVQHYNMAKVFWLDQLKTTFSAYYHDIMTYLHDKLQLSNDISLSERNLRTYLNKLTVLPGFCLNFSCAKLHSWCLALLSRVNILLHAHFHRLR